MNTIDHRKPLADTQRNRERQKQNHDEIRERQIGFVRIEHQAGIGGEHTTYLDAQNVERDRYHRVVEEARHHGDDLWRAWFPLPVRLDEDRPESWCDTCDDTLVGYLRTAGIHKRPGPFNPECECVRCRKDSVQDQARAWRTSFRPNTDRLLYADPVTRCGVIGAVLALLLAVTLASLLGVALLVF